MRHHAGCAVHDPCPTECDCPAERIYNKADLIGILKPIRGVTEKYRDRLPITEWSASVYLGDMENAIKETLELAGKG